MNWKMIRITLLCVAAWYILAFAAVAAGIMQLNFPDWALVPFVLPLGIMPITFPVIAITAAALLVHDIKEKSYFIFLDALVIAITVGYMIVIVKNA